MALDILDPAMETPISPSVPHVWLPMGELETERQTLQRGLRIVAAVSDVNERSRAVI